METLFLYIFKLIVCSGVMFLYYQLFLKDKTFHHYNRFYLLAILVISIGLPAVRIGYFTIATDSSMYMLLHKLQNVQSIEKAEYDFIYYQLALAVAGMVSLFFLAKLLLGFLQISKLKRSYKKEYYNGISFYQTDLSAAPFSFFKNLFWKNSIQVESDLGKQILKHEMVHIEQKHSWDKVLVESFTALFWFNPFFYLVKKELHTVHEYLADKKSIKNSDTAAFAQMLLAGYFSGKQLPATSAFASSHLKKRLTMLKKSKSKFGYARKILALPLLFILTFLYLVDAKNKEIETTNSEISKMVKEIQREKLLLASNEKAADTIAFGKDGTQLYETHPEIFFSSDTITKNELKEVNAQILLKNKSIEKVQQEVQRENAKAQQLSKEMQKKSSELQKLSKAKKPDDAKINHLEKQVDQLGNQIDALYNSEAAKKMEQHYAEIDGLYAKADTYYKSKSFKDAMKAAEEKARIAEEKWNNPEFQKRLKDAEKRAEEAEKKFNSPEFQKRLKDAEKRAEEAEKKFNSPEFQKRLKDAEKRAEEAEKKFNSPEFQKRLKDAEKRAEEAATQNPKVIILKSTEKNKYDDIAITVDGKPISKEEMNSLDPNKIESVSVFKKEVDGNKKGEIQIKLKK